MLRAERRRTRAALAAAGTAVAVLLAGCSGGDDAAPSGSEQASGSEDAAGGAEGGGGEDEGGADDGADGASQAGVAEVDPEDVLVEQVVEQPDDPDDRATIGVHSLRVEGEVNVLTLVVTPDFASVSDSDTVSLFDVFTGVGLSFSPSLLDREHLKRYTIVGGGPGQRFASEAALLRSRNGEPMVAYAVYAAPEDDIDAVDVVLADGWPAFTDVPIER